MLTSALSAAEIDGIQGQGVIACAKHFIDNNQEGPGHNGRLITSVNIQPRAQRELYYKAFQGAIAAKVGSIMCSYNLINGTCVCRVRCCHHPVALARPRVPAHHARPGRRWV